MTDTREACPPAEFPIEPWELRAYVEEEPERTYIAAAQMTCPIARYCADRFGETTAVSHQGLQFLDQFGFQDNNPRYALPDWASEFIEAFDDRFDEEGRTVAVSGKQILEADILPRD